MLEEGINDPAIFKAVFLAGGPGSGKSFIVGQTALTALGLKLVNSDDAFEQALKKAGMEATPDSIFSTRGQQIRDRAKAITKKRQDRYIQGRLGLVIDGTGKDFTKIANQKKALELLGYDTMMILVNTDEPTAQARNQSRARTLPASEVKKMWAQVQNNIGKFQNIFGSNFIIVDNSEDSNWGGAVMSAYRKVSKWTRTPPQNYRAKKWMSGEKKIRGIKEVMDPDAGIGDYVRDFKKSDAPQFRGKSKAKRRQMAVAAYLAKKRKKESVEEESLKTSDYPKGTSMSAQKFKDSQKKKKDAPALKTSDYRKGTSMSASAWKKQNEAFQWMNPSLSKTVYKYQYKKAMPVLQQLLDRKKKEGGGKLKHGVEYYAARVARTLAPRYPNLDARTLANMIEGIEYNPQKHEWGTEAGKEYMHSNTPGEKKTVCKECEGAGCSHCDYRGSHSLKEHCGCEHDDYDDWTLDDQDMAELEAEADNMTFEDMIEYGMYDVDDFEIDEDDPHSEVQITEALSVQGRLKRKFNARKNKQKLKIARNLAMRRASDSNRLKRRSKRGARNMIYKRLLRGRSRAKLPPSERARLEKMIDTRFSGFISRLSTRMLPNMRKAEMARLKKRGGSKPKTSKKYKAAKPKVAKSQKSKKFKVKK